MHLNTASLCMADYYNNNNFFFKNEEEHAIILKLRLYHILPSRTINTLTTLTQP